MRILGIDPGERRMGLAVSDEMGITAQGLDTFDRRGGGDFFIFLSELIAEYGVGEIVVGDPVHLSGRSGESSERARKLAADVQRRLEIPVRLWDERLSSEEARRVLREARPTTTKMKRRPRKAPKKVRDTGVVDRLAAQLILQSYLDYRRRDT